MTGNNHEADTAEVVSVPNDKGGRLTLEDLRQRASSLVLQASILADTAPRVTTPIGVIDPELPIYGSPEVPSLMEKLQEKIRIGNIAVYGYAVEEVLSVSAQQDKPTHDTKAPAEPELEIADTNGSTNTPDDTHPKTDVVSTLVDIRSPVFELPPTMERLMRQYDLKRHYRVPANMRNFLSEVLPRRLNDDVYMLGTFQASIFTHMLIRAYVAINKIDNSRLSTRKKSARYIERHVGLRDEELSPRDLAARMVVADSDVYNRIRRVKDVMKNPAMQQRIITMLELVQNNDASEIANMILDFEKQLEDQSK